MILQEIARWKNSKYINEEILAFKCCTEQDPTIGVLMKICVFVTIATRNGIFDITTTLVIESSMLGYNYRMLHPHDFFKRVKIAIWTVIELVERTRLS